MSDADIVQSAYADALTRLFAVYLGALASAGGRTSAEAQAANDFKSGLVLARKARDQAIELVKQGISG
ncbi:MAG: hypothetical protein ACREPU_14275 [Rhodanobacteraceae bacterium]